VGADYLVSREMMVGVAVHGDTLHDAGAATTIAGKGVMVGPYVSTELVDNVYLDVAGYYGKSWNDVTDGGYSGSFDTQRWIGTAVLKGDVALSDDMTFTPNVTAFYLRETADGYTLSNGGGGTLAGAAIDNSQLRLSGGAAIDYDINMDNGDTLTPMIGANLGIARVDNGDRIFGSVATGLTYRAGSSTSIGAQIEAAGDETSFRSVTARTTARASF
jgi:outer membrane autotransporter protein